MKRFLNLFLVLAMLITCICIVPVNAATTESVGLWSAGNATETPDSKHDTLDAALSAALTADMNNFTIRLLKDITLTSTVTLNNTKAVNYTIDGNGHQITFALESITGQYGNDTPALSFKGDAGASITMKDVNISASQATCLKIISGTITFIGGNYVSTNAGFVRAINIDNSTTDSATHANFISGNFSVSGKGTGTSGSSEQYFAVVYVGASSGVNGKYTCTADFYGGYFLAYDANQAVVADNYSVMNVYGGTFETKLESNSFALMANVGAQVNVYGGNFILPEASTRANIYQNKNTSVLKLYGGNFKGGAAPVAYIKAGESTQTWCYPTSAVVDGNFYSYAVEGNGVGTSLNAEGKSVRLTAPNGLRFTTTVSAATEAYVKTLIDASTDISFGTIIAPKTTVDTLYSFTFDALTAAGKAAGTDYVDIPAVEGTYIGDDGARVINAALVDIKDANLEKDFSAVAYIKATINGQTVYFYSAYLCTDDTNTTDVNEAKSVGNITAVATAALNDTKELDAAEGDYKYLVEGTTNTYSPYTTAQRATLTACTQPKAQG